MRPGSPAGSNGLAGNRAQGARLTGVLHRMRTGFDPSVHRAWRTRQGGIFGVRCATISFEIRTVRTRILVEALVDRLAILCRARSTWRTTTRQPERISTVRCGRAQPWEEGVPCETVHKEVLRTYLGP